MPPRDRPPLAPPTDASPTASSPPDAPPTDTPVAPRPAADQPAARPPGKARTVALARIATLSSIVALVVLGIVWEAWLAPLRPGGSMLVLKVVPLLVALPGLWRGRRKSVQAMSLLIQLYLTEGLVRATSDRGFSATLAIVELVLAGIAFAAVLVWARTTRPTPPALSPSLPTAAPDAATSGSPSERP